VLRDRPDQTAQRDSLTSAACRDFVRSDPPEDRKNGQKAEIAMKMTEKQKRKHRRRAKLKQTLRRLRKKG
jgi:hypothetical protein